MYLVLSYSWIARSAGGCRARGRGAGVGHEGDRLLELRARDPLREEVRGHARVAFDERSLRAYAEVLYLKVGTTVQPSMAIILRDEPVVVREEGAHFSFKAAGFRRR